MTRPPLAAVLFDAGGTLVRIDFEWLAAMLAELGETVSAGELRRAELRGRRMYDATCRAPRELAPGEPHPALGSAGDITAYFAGMLEAADVRHPVLEEALERIAERQRPPNLLWSRLNEGAREAIDGVLALGLRAACVSNSDGRAEHHLVTTGTRDGLEFVVDSQLVGVEKPDPAIFRIALERMGIPATRALYVGDIRGVDERGSRAAGLEFVLIDPSGGYAGPDTRSVRAIGEIPGYIREHFEVSLE